MTKERDLAKELEGLGIFNLESTGMLNEESAFAAIDAITSYNQQYTTEIHKENIRKAQQKKRELIEGK